MSTLETYIRVWISRAIRSCSRRGQRRRITVVLTRKCQLSCSLPTILISTLPWHILSMECTSLSPNQSYRHWIIIKPLAKAVDEQGILARCCGSSHASRSLLHLSMLGIVFDRRPWITFSKHVAYRSQPKHGLESFKMWAGRCWLLLPEFASCQLFRVDSCWYCSSHASSDDSRINACNESLRNGYKRIHYSDSSMAELK